MCFRKRRQILPESKLSHEKMNNYFKEYLTHVNMFLLDHLSENKIELSSEFKTNLDDIKAKMAAHANRHTVEYNENIIEVYMTCLKLVETQFGAILVVLHEKDQLVLHKQLRKLKSMRELLNLNTPSGSIEHN
jgi:hypothetical protein